MRGVSGKSALLVLPNGAPLSTTPVALEVVPSFAREAKAKAGATSENLAATKAEIGSHKIKQNPRIASCSANL